MMRMELRLCQLPECSMCKQTISSERDYSGVNLFGFAQYAVCLNCWQEVPESERTRGYKSRWTRRFNAWIRERENAMVEASEKERD